ncbi:hypothetical protein HDU96_010937 [Phlyctochytrium bullatum]|nr:hypothetical protein HDU96_010937 [Phlyctochytrium bullatum]
MNPITSITSTEAIMLQTASTSSQQQQQQQLPSALSNRIPKSPTTTTAAEPAAATAAATTTVPSPTSPTASVPVPRGWLLSLGLASAPAASEPTTSTAPTPASPDDIAAPALVRTSTPGGSNLLHRRTVNASSSAETIPSSTAATEAEKGVYHRPASSLAPTATTAAYQDHAQLLASAKKTPEELQNLKKLGLRGKRLIKFYENQNELIEELLNPNPEEDPEELEKKLLKLKIALYGSTAANIMLFALQLVAAIVSGSLALFATMADSFMDIASSLVLVITGVAAGSKKGKDQHKYPTGRKRFETAGIIVFSCIMGALSVQLVIEGARALISKNRDVELGPLSLSLVGVALGCKVFLYFYCAALSQFQTARILAQDHLNDLVLNAFGIGLSVLGNYVVWWIDPSGAILIALLILRSWSGTAMEHVQMLVGKSASPAFLSKVTYLAMTHPEVMQVDTVRAYHAGEGFFVEVDIVLPPEMPLYRAHDIGESLQIKLEDLKEVERAFVHLDYETTHKPEHKMD